MSSSSGPRKFSEKIALLNQKQAEADAAFISIMGEVQSIRPNQPMPNAQATIFNANAPNIDQGSFQVPSSPTLNVSINNRLSNNVSPDVHNASNEMFNEQRQNIEYCSQQRGIVKPQLCLDNSRQMHDAMLKNEPIAPQISQYSPNLNNTNHFNFQPEIIETNITLQEQHQHQHQKFMESSCNPTNFNLINREEPTDMNHSPFLQLPPNDSFRRAHSDSSLHQTAAASNMNNMNLQNCNDIYGNGSNLNPLSLQRAQSNFPIQNYNQFQVKKDVPPPMITTESYNIQLSHNNPNAQMKTPNSLMPNPNYLNTNNAMNNNNNNINPSTFVSLPDLSSFHYPIETQPQDNLLSIHPPQHNHIGPVKPTHQSVSPTRNMARYSPTNFYRRASPQRLENTQIARNHARTNFRDPNAPRNGPQNFNYTNMNNVQMANGIYRSNNPNESLPPSPQSQQSCINSPQGSPGPHTLSAQDMNPFNTNNCETIQKQLDSINLDASGSYSNNTFNKASSIPSSPSHYMPQQGLMRKQSSPIATCNIITNNTNVNAASPQNISMNANNGVSLNYNINDVNTGGQHIVQPQISQNPLNRTNSKSSSNPNMYSQNRMEMNNNNNNNNYEPYDRLNVDNEIVDLASPLKNASFFKSNEKNIPDIILTFSDSTDDNKEVKVLNNDFFNMDDLGRHNEPNDFDNIQLYHDIPNNENFGNT